MKGKQTSNFSLKRLLQDNSVPIMFVLICLICLPLAGYSPAYLINELVTRMGRNTFLILAVSSSHKTASAFYSRKKPSTAIANSAITSATLAFIRRRSRPITAAS